MDWVGFRWFKMVSSFLSCGGQWFGVVDSGLKWFHYLSGGGPWFGVVLGGLELFDHS